MSRFIALTLVLSTMLISLVGHAQVFIPDQLERDWLNAEIPGIVDAGGIMDTLHPGIAGLDTAQFSLNTLPPSIEIHGLAYLDDLVSFVLSNSLANGLPTTVFTVEVQGLPPSLRALYVSLYTEGSLHIQLPEMPSEMDLLRIESLMLGSLGIVRLPEQIELFHLQNPNSLSWTGDCQVNDMLISGMGLTPGALEVPAIFAERVDIEQMTIEMLDLSQVVTPHLTLESCHIPGSLAWPAGLEWLTFEGNGDAFGMLPAFPNGLQRLETESTLFNCLPTLPESLEIFYANGIYFPCFPNWPTSLTSYSFIDEVTPETAIYCSVLNSTCPGANPGIAGRIFADSDADGQYDAGEPGLPQTQVVLQPNGQVTGCNGDGTWEIGVLPGEYTISAASGYPYIQSMAPATHSASVPNMGDTDLGNDFAVTLIPDIQDLHVSLYADPARPGFDNRLYLTCQNYGTIPVDAELTLSYDGDQTWVGSSVMPSSSTGTTASWSLPGMAIGTSTTISVDLNTAASVALGTDVIHTLSADPIATDETPANNTTQFTDSVVGSYDPNDKLLSPSVLSPAQVQAEDKPIEYTIRFQNTGTFLAERVVILDTLSEDLQWASMQFIASSHANHWYITDGVLHVIHSDIMLPDSTSDEAGSHGFVKFSILPSADLQDGAEISNIAHIVFDFNEPIITPPAIFRVDVLAGIREKPTSTFTLYPNPVKDLLRVSTDMTTRGIITYSVDDILGKRLLQGTLDNAAQISVSGLANGVYNLTIDRAGQRQVAQFVKE